MPRSVPIPPHTVKRPPDSAVLAGGFWYGTVVVGMLGVTVAGAACGMSCCMTGGAVVVAAGAGVVTVTTGAAWTGVTVGAAWTGLISVVEVVGTVTGDAVVAGAVVAGAVVAGGGVVVLVTVVLVTVVLAG